MQKCEIQIPTTEYTKGMRLRLAKKTGWSEEKMEAVIGEYLRYITLIVLYSKGEMQIEATPSQDID